MGDSIRFGMFVVAVAAVAVGAWIGHRATVTHAQQQCFGTAKGAIACVDPAKGKVSYRVYFIGDHNKVQSLPSD